MQTICPSCGSTNAKIIWIYSSNKKYPAIQCNACQRITTINELQTSFYKTQIRSKFEILAYNALKKAANLK